MGKFLSPDFHLIVGKFTENTGDTGAGPHTVEQIHKKTEAENLMWLSLYTPFCVELITYYGTLLFAGIETCSNYSARK